MITYTVCVWMSDRSEPDAEQHGLDLDGMDSFVASYNGDDRVVLMDVSESDGPAFRAFGETRVWSQ